MRAAVMFHGWDICRECQPFGVFLKIEILTQWGWAMNRNIIVILEWLE